MKDTTLGTLVQKIDATPAEAVSKPVEYLISEARQFFKLMETEAPKFEAKGLPAEFLTLGYAISDVLEKSESEWITSRFGEPEVVARWKERSVDGFKLRSELLAELGVALMDHSDAIHSLKSIKKGKSSEDMLLDIPKLIKLARCYPEDTATFGITDEYLANAETTVQQLTSLFSSAEIAIDENRQLKVARDKAKVFTAGYLSIIRKYADVIYRDDPEMRERFVSKYDSARNKASHDKEEEETTDPTDPETPTAM